MAVLAHQRKLEERVQNLRRSWNAKADEFADHHCDAAAAAYRQAAEDVERELRAWNRELLTIAEAAEESGYSKEHLRRLVRKDKLLTERGKGARSRLHLRRGVLPAKSGQTPGGASEVRSVYDPAEDARDIAKRLGGENA
jgi:hypothetical protein